MPADLSGIMSQAETEQAQYLQQAGCPTAFNLERFATRYGYKIHPKPEGAETIIAAHNAAVADYVEHHPVDDWATLRDQTVSDFMDAWRAAISSAKPWSDPITAKSPPPPPATPEDKWQGPWPEDVKFTSKPKTGHVLILGSGTWSFNGEEWIASVCDRDGPHKPMQPRPTPQRTIPAWPTHDPLAALYAPYEPPV